MHRIALSSPVKGQALRWSAQVASAVAAAWLVACAGTESTASRSAAAFDEALRKGKAVGSGGAHAGHQHPETPAAVPSPAPPDHGAMTHSHAPTGTASKEGSDPHAAMDHDHAAMGHESSPSEAVDHSSKGHGAVPQGAQPQAASAQPGAAAGTLAPDALDGPAATAVEEAQRAGQMGSEGHGRHGGHGAQPFRQIDADKVPDAAASGHATGRAAPVRQQGKDAKDEPDPHHDHHQARPTPPPPEPPKGRR